LETENFPSPHAGESEYLEKPVMLRPVLRDLLHLFRRPDRFLDTFHSWLVAFANGDFSINSLSLAREKIP